MRAPKVPDPTKTAAAQTASNQGTAISQQLLNMTNQVTPYGNLTYNQTGTRTYFDPSLNKEVSLPSYTATTQLSPEQQALLNQQTQFDSRFNDIALQQTGRIGDMLGTPFDYNPGEHEAWAGDLYGKLNNDTNAAAMAGMEQKLANQGLQPGTQAYDDAMRNLTYGQDKARNDFLLNSYGQGFQTALTERNQPINETTALMSGGQVQQPQFASTPQTGVNGTDIAGLTNAAYQAKLGNYQSTMGGLMGLGSSLLGGAFMLSDKRSKQNISEIGKLKDGTKLYSYEYKPEFGGKKGLMHIGVMANEAAKKHPDAVARGDDGYLRVNYNRIAEELSQ